MNFMIKVNLFKRSTSSTYSLLLFLQSIPFLLFTFFLQTFEVKIEIITCFFI